MKYFGKSPNIVVGSDGTTYGPAEARISRNPITFTPDMVSGPSTSGEYENGKIRVNPNSPSIGAPGMPVDVGNVIRHEEVHALMDKIPNNMKVASNPIEYMPLVRPVRASTMGNPQDEVPAYAITQPPGQVGAHTLYGGPASAGDQASYVGALLNNIARINPQIAAQMQRLRSK